MDAEIVTPSDFGRPLLPIGSPVVIPSPDLTWSDQDWRVIARGHRSRDMDDRWHAVVLEDRLFLHRSWTGHGIYEAQFVLVGGRRRIGEARVEADTANYRRGTDEYESLLLVQLIEGVLLGRWDDALRRRLAALRQP